MCVCPVSHVNHHQKTNSSRDEGVTILCGNPCFIMSRCKSGPFPLCSLRRFPPPRCSFCPGPSLMFVMCVYICDLDLFLRIERNLGPATRKAVHVDLSSLRRLRTRYRQLMMRQGRSASPARVLREYRWECLVIVVYFGYGGHGIQLGHLFLEPLWQLLCPEFC